MTGTRQPANVKDSAARHPKPVTPPPPKPDPADRPSLHRAPPPVAPATEISITGLTDVGINLIHVLATSAGPVRSSRFTPSVASSLRFLGERGIAEVTGKGSTDRLYGLTERGRALVTVLWDAPADKPARKPRAPRKPKTQPPEDTPEPQS